MITFEIPGAAERATLADKAAQRSIQKHIEQS